MNPIRYWLEDAKKQPDTRHVDTCDGIRTLAILIVGWFHIWQQSWLYPELNIFGKSISFDPLVRSGYIWVDTMILISGFCLYLPWARIRRDGGSVPQPLDFYARRIMRIHPSYLLTIGVMLAIALGTGAYRTREHLALDLASHLTYTHTFFYESYYATNLGGALWTLGIEMQFYLIFPLLARAFTRLPATTFAVMTGVSLAFRGWVGVNVADDSMYFNQLAAYLDTFAFGMAAAAIHTQLSSRRHGPFSRVVCSLLSVAVLALLFHVAKMQASCSGTEAIHRGQMSNRLAMGFLGAALLVFSANAGLMLRKIFSNRFTRFFSSISFQFYIWHQTLAVWILQARLVPSDALYPNYEGDHAWQLAYTAVCFIGAIALSALLTYGFERPVARALQAKWNAWRAGKQETSKDVKGA